MNRRIQILTAAVFFAAVSCFPMSAVAQTTIKLDVLPDTPILGFTAVDILVKTDVTPNTFGSATVDVQFNPGLWSFTTNQAADLNAFNEAFDVECDLHFASDIVNNCADGVPYKIEPPSVLTDNGTYVRFTATGGNVGKNVGGALVDSLRIPGLEIGNSFVKIGRFLFQPVTSPDRGSASKSAVVDFEIIVGTLSIGFFQLLDNFSETDSCTGPVQDRDPACGEIDDDCEAGAGGCTIEGPLPVELADFSAIVDNDDVTLTWSTASETDNAGFSVEHAVGAEGSFEEIAFVDGAGTSLEARTYTHTVKGLDVGTHRFRLKQLDYDGSFEFSSVVETSLELAGTHRLGAAYPNPFNPSTTFELVVGREQHVKIDVINALGQRVQRLFDGSMEANKPTNFTFQAGNLPTGLYFYRVVGETFAQTRQALLVK